MKHKYYIQVHLKATASDFFFFFRGLGESPCFDLFPEGDFAIESQTHKRVGCIKPICRKENKRDRERDRETESKRCVLDSCCVN